MVPPVRENAGLHVYDGVTQDLSPSGVRDGLARIADDGGGGGDHHIAHHDAAHHDAAHHDAAHHDAAHHDAAHHDAAHLRAFEDLLRVSLGVIEDHRTNPYL